MYSKALAVVKPLPEVGVTGVSCINEVFGPAISLSAPPGVPAITKFSPKTRVTSDSSTRA